LAPPKVKRGQIWAADLTPQSHPAEPGKRGRPVLVIQTDLLNDAGHPTTVIIPGTTKVEPDAQPLRVPIGQLQKPGEDAQETDLMLDQIRTIANDRFMGDGPLKVLNTNQIRLVERALKKILSLP